MALLERGATFDLIREMKQLINLWATCYKNRNRTYKSLKGYMKDMDIWIAAYMKVASNKGASTPGPDGKTLAGTTLRKLENLKKVVLLGEYDFLGARRIEIPKPGNKGSKRPLSIPAASDKIVQEVLRMILEPIYEFTFSPNTHGFRRGRSCHTALGQIDRDFKPIKWVIEGDIRKYFDTVNHDILMSIINKRVQDPLILSLIHKGLKAKIFAAGKDEERSTLGIPQGGVLSPLLSNIYLHEFDKYIEQYIERFDVGNRPMNNPEYDRAMHKKIRPPKGVIPYVYNSPRYKRMKYVRYADDFVIGVRGSIKDAKKIKSDIANFLDTKLKISLHEDKTSITHIGGSFNFLGHRIYIARVHVWQKCPAPSRVLGRVYRVVKHNALCIDGNKTRLISKLTAMGMIKQKLPPRGQLLLIGQSYHPFLPYPQSIIINKYNSILRGLAEWWKYAGNRRSLLHHLGYLMKISAAKTLAHKYKLNLQKVLLYAGPHLSRPIKKPAILGLTDQRIAEWQNSIGKHTSKRAPMPKLLYTQYSETPGALAFKIGKNWVPDFWKELEKLPSSKLKTDNLMDIPTDSVSFLASIERNITRGVKLLNAQCTLCGSSTDVQMHHIKKVSAIKAESETERRVKAFNRKQIPLCSVCHLDIHNKNWRNPPKNPKK
jgi:group II intron reverse transcriptase/maturase